MPNELNRVGLYVAAKPLSQDNFYFEIEIVDTGLIAAIGNCFVLFLCCISGDILFFFIQGMKKQSSSNQHHACFSFCCISYYNCYVTATDLLPKQKPSSFKMTKSVH